jgi:hypothetical protein
MGVSRDAGAVLSSQSRFIPAILKENIGSGKGK